MKKKLIWIAVALILVAIVAIYVWYRIAQPVYLPPQAFGEKLEKLSHRETERVEIWYDIPEQYVQPILELCNTGLDGFAERYGIDVLDYIPNRKIQVIAMWGRQNFKCTTGEGRIYMQVSSEEDLGESDDAGKGAHHVYGFLHEIGHIIIGFHDSPEFNEGAASYLGTVLIPYVHDKLGDSAWGQPYDYLNRDGVWPGNGREDQEAKLIELGMLKPGSLLSAGNVLHLIEQKHGAEFLGQVIKKIRAKTTARKCSLEQFKKTLIEVSGDESIREVFVENGF